MGVGEGEYEAGNGAKPAARAEAVGGAVLGDLDPIPADATIIPDENINHFKEEDGGRPWNRTRRASPRGSYSPLPHLAACRPLLILSI